MKTLNNDIHSFQEKLFSFVIFFTYLLYFLIFFKLFGDAPVYLHYLDMFFKTYIALFLVYRFNPFRKVQFTDLDRRVSFSAGLFILTTNVLNSLYIYFHDLKQKDNLTLYN
jgi:hypothetical protein